MKELLVGLSAFMLSALLFTACHVDSKSDALRTLHSERLDSVWYQGKAEVNVYSLNKNRYQQQNPGEMIQLFVKEPFFPQRQVKDEPPRSPRSMDVLKSNTIQRFSTGLYDYQLMTSVFSLPLEEDTLRMLKLTNSTQDWCGQSFIQANWEQQNQRYRIAMRSYFEERVDTVVYLPDSVLFEDQLLNNLRTSPNNLLIKNQDDMVPPFALLQLMHWPIKAYRVQLTHAFFSDELRSLTISYPELKREVVYEYRVQKPYQVVSISDLYPSLLDGKKTHLELQDSKHCVVRILEAQPPIRYCMAEEIWAWIGCLSKADRRRVDLFSPHQFV